MTPGQIKNISSIRRNRVFKIITHGYLCDSDTKWMQDIKNTYLQKDDYNVILVDWRKFAYSLYPVAAQYTKNVGNVLGQLIVDLNQSLGVPYYNIHLLGHSLGAHISGFAGKYTQTFNFTVKRLTAMDPAGPLFFKTNDLNRLSRSDATFVDVIHTDSLRYGYILPLGSIDFYVNGGIGPQPGCYSFDGVKDNIRKCCIKLK